MSPPPHDDRPDDAGAVPEAGPGAPGFAADDVSAFLDGELTDEQMAAFEAELERNAALRGELDEVREVAEWLAADGPTEAPMGFANRVMDRIEAAHPASGPSWWAWLRRPWGLPLAGWVVGLAAAIVLMMLIPRGQTIDPAALATRQDPEPVAEPPTVTPDVPPPADDEPVVPKEPAAETTPPPRKPIRRVEPPPAPVSSAQGVTEGTGDLGLVESTTPPTDAEDVPSPSDAGTPSTQAPFVKPSGTAVERALARARQRPIEVSSADPDMLARVLKLCARFGGAFDIQGREIADATLRQPLTEVFVRVPHDGLRGFERQLADLGYRVDVLDAAPLLAGTEVTVRLRLRYDLAPLTTSGNAASDLFEEE